MIGIFDSGSGGLTFLAAMKRRHPEWSYIYHADYDHCPYGDRSPEEIQTLTTIGVQRLFDAGATIVVLACNTASAWTLRKLQIEIFPDKKILGVTIPGAEKVVELGLKHVTVFATEQTVKSRTYAERVRILDENMHVDEIAISGGLVRAIEALLPIQRCHTEKDFEALFTLYGPDGWVCDGPEWHNLVREYFGCIQSCQCDHACASIQGSCLSDKNPLFHSTKEGKHKTEALVLGCTHYSYIKKSLQYLFPELPLIDPSEEAAERLSDYIHKHHISLSQTGGIRFI